MSQSGPQGTRPREFLFRAKTPQNYLTYIGIDLIAKPWSKNPFVRGQIIDKSFGNNLGSNFPVVDRLDDGILYSFKSYDTAAKTYQTTPGFFNRLKCDINSLNDFAGRSWGGVTVNVGDYSRKVLQIGVPDRLLSAEQSKALADAIVYAAEKSIDVVVKVVK